MQNSSAKAALSVKNERVVEISVLQLISEAFMIIRGRQVPPVFFMFFLHN